MCVLCLLLFVLALKVRGHSFDQMPYSIANYDLCVCIDKCTFFSHFQETIRK